MRNELKIKLILLILLSLILACDVTYPELKEVDYSVNYYFNSGSFDYSMDFDIAAKVLKSDRISKIILENKNTSELIIVNNNTGSDSSKYSLGHDIFYYKNLRFNFYDKTFNSFELNLRFFDDGIREYHKSIIISLNLSNSDLRNLYKIVYKDKDIEALKKMQGLTLYLIKKSKSDNSILEIDSIDNLNNIKKESDKENYLFIGNKSKNASIVFKLD